MPIRRMMSPRVSNTRSLQHRLAKLEAQAGQSPEPLPPIFVVFVDRHGECPTDRASTLGDDHVWHRTSMETQENFKRRVMADAPSSTDHATVVIFWSEDNE